MVTCAASSKRVEKKEQVRQGASADIREIYTEARSQGVNVPALRNIVRERTKDPAKRAQVEAAMQAYRAELGMIAGSAGAGEMSIREAAMTTGFSRSAIHRELSHRKEIPVRWDGRRAHDRSSRRSRRGVPQRRKSVQWDSRCANGRRGRRFEHPAVPEAREIVAMSSGGIRLRR